MSDIQIPEVSSGDLPEGINPDSGTMVTPDQVPAPAPAAAAPEAAPADAPDAPAEPAEPAEPLAPLELDCAHAACALNNIIAHIIEINFFISLTPGSIIKIRLFNYLKL